MEEEEEEEHRRHWKRYPRCLPGKTLFIHKVAMMLLGQKGLVGWTVVVVVVD